VAITHSIALTGRHNNRLLPELLLEATAPLQESRTKPIVNADKGACLRVCLFDALTIAFVLFHTDGSKALSKIHTYPLLRSQIPPTLVRGKLHAGSPELSPKHNKSNHITSPFRQQSCLQARTPLQRSAYTCSYSSFCASACPWLSFPL
jgi:hypothetical protein